jgi:hypothetical protein
MQRLFFVLLRAVYLRKLRGGRLNPVMTINCLSVVRLSLIIVTKIENCFFEEKEQGFVTFEYRCLKKAQKP